MYRVFKKKDRVNGKIKLSPKWYIEFRDHLGRPQRTPATTDKSSSVGFARQLEQLVNCRISRGELSRDLREWIDSLPPEYAKRLVRMGLIDASRLAAGESLEKHLKAYLAALQSRGRAEAHIELYGQRLRRIFTEIGATHWADLTSARIEEAVRGLKTKQGRLLHGGTRNHYLTAVKAFSNWMVKSRRATQSPAARIDPVAFERREYRRALNPEEVQWLLDAAFKGGVFSRPDRCGGLSYCIDGHERALLYSLAIQTGLRASPLRRLRVRDFHLDDEERPTLVVPGRAATKNKKTMSLPLQPSLATLLRGHFEAKHPEAAAFAMPPKLAVASMVRADLAAAREEWLQEAADDPTELHRRRQSHFLAPTDEDGRRVDFHALRATAATMLVVQGVAEGVVTSIIGHSTYTTTARHYVRVWEDAKRSAVDRLPVLVAKGADLGRSLGRPERRTAAEAGGVRRPQERPNTPSGGVAQTLVLPQEVA